MGIFLIPVTLRSQGPVVYTADCPFEFVDNPDKLVRHEINCCPARAADLIVFPKPPYCLLYLCAALRTNHRQNIIFENACHLLVPYVEYNSMSDVLRIVMLLGPGPSRICGN